MSSDGELCDAVWAVYTKAVGVQERKRHPAIGPSVGRRAFAYTASMHNDKHTHAYMCFVCFAIKVDTSRIRSDIEMVSGKWLFSMPYGALRKNLSLHDFKRKCAGPGPLLHARNRGHPNDISSPDFGDWIVHLSEAIPWTGVSMDNRKTRYSSKMKQMDRAKKDCCVVPKTTYAHKVVTTTRRFASNAKYRFVTIVNCAWETTKRHL